MTEVPKSVDLIKHPPKELATEDWDMLVPLEHIFLGSSMDHPDAPEDIPEGERKKIGGLAILDRGPDFYLTLPTKTSAEKLKIREDFTYKNIGFLAILEPPVEMALLDRAGYSFRLIFPPVNKNTRQVNPTYQIQLTKKIEDGTTERGYTKYRYEQVPPNEPLSDSVEGHLRAIQIASQYQSRFKLENVESTKSSIRAFNVTVGK